MMKVKIKEFEEAIDKNDFAVGDSFWIGNWEFEVVNRKGNASTEKEVVFKWELTKEDFVQVLRDNQPEIENPEELFNKHKDEIVGYFTKGFDVLIGGCGATYGTIINDAIEGAMK